MYRPRGVAEQDRLAEEIARVEPLLLGPDVVRFRYDVKPNWSDEPAIYFKIVLSDDAAKRERLHKVASQVESVIEERIDPRHTWDLVPYYNFRSKSEYDTMKDPAWS